MDRGAFFRTSIGRLLFQFKNSDIGTAFQVFLQSLANILAPHRPSDYYFASHEKHFVFPRPPGSQALESLEQTGQPLASFESLCTQCGDCSHACPEEAIFTAKGGPFLDTNLRACHICEDFPCIAACETGALSPLPKNTLPYFGMAEVIESNCIHKIADGSLPDGLQHNLELAEKSCDRCWQSCPVEGAIYFEVDSQLPKISQACIGCGICLQACPMEPVAIKMSFDSIR